MGEVMAEVFLPQAVIRKKRDGGILSADEISGFVNGITDQSVSEGQIAGFAMAVYFNGMSDLEKVTLTECMAHSGSMLDWTSENLPGPVLDKHSSGGVGDKVSLILAPILAACGGFAPMISGRGLGHTGGTLDKLESIPGYTTAPDLKTFRRVVRDVGCAIIGQTADLAPADRRFYAVRDVTATIESIPLITASILSKKLAAGSEALVMDVKTGSGAFASGRDMAEQLAHSIVSVANGAGLKTTALITDMNQVLGRSAGNALEVGEAIALLRNATGDERLREVTLALSAELCVLGGLAGSIEDGRSASEAALTDGRALELFARMVHGLGGPADLCQQPQKYLALAPVQKPVFAEQSGYLKAIDVQAVGMAIVEMGGGRRRVSDEIDPSAGLERVAAIGDPVGGDAPLAIIHAASEEVAARAAERIRAAVDITEQAPAPAPVVLAHIGAETGS